MSFYVTLPSNSSTQSSNTQANFTTYLNNPLILNSKFEVALSEICFSGGFNVKLGSFKFLNPMFYLYEHRTEFIEFEMTIKNGISIDEFKDKLNNKLQSSCVTVELLDRYMLYHNPLNEIVIRNSTKYAIKNFAKIDTKNTLEVYY